MSSLLLLDFENANKFDILYYLDILNCNFVDDSVEELKCMYQYLFCTQWRSCSRFYVTRSYKREIYHKFKNTSLLKFPQKLDVIRAP